MNSSIKIQRTENFDILSNLARNGYISIIIPEHLCLNQVLLILSDCFDKKNVYREDNVSYLGEYLSTAKETRFLSLRINETDDGELKYWTFNQIDLPKIHYKQLYSKLPVFSISKLKEMYESD